MSVVALMPNGWKHNPLVDDDCEPVAAFAVPERAADMGYTHALIGYHSLRGWMLLRWLKPDLDEAKARTDALTLYGSSINSMKAVPLEVA